MDNGSNVEAVIARAERRGFRLAVTGRTLALLPIGVIHPFGYQSPNSLYVAAIFFAAIALGLIPLKLIDTRYERIGRFLLFTFDMAVLSAVLAFAPISSGGDVPQNLVFHTSRGEYFFVVLAVSTLTLSPLLVLWTGFCGAVGLAAATAWIAVKMDHIITFTDLPAAPSRQAFLDTVLDQSFLGISVRINEATNIALDSCIIALAVHRSRQVISDHARSEIERSRLKDLFGRFVPSQVVEKLVADQLVPQTRHATILFADIEGFTQLSEALEPMQIVKLLNTYFGEASHIVHANGGVVINFVGDALIAAFNAPLPTTEYGTKAVETARMLLRLVSSRDFEGHRLSIRIGIATGDVCAGNVGTDERQAYTLYGDTVNLSQRLEQMNKQFGTSCLLCEETYKGITDQKDRLSSKGAVQVRGREQATTVFSLSANEAGNMLL